MRERGCQKQNGLPGSTYPSSLNVWRRLCPIGRIPLAAHPVQAGSAFDCVDMKEKGFYHMPPQSVAGMQQQCEEKKTEGEALPYMKETLPPPPGLYYSCDPAVHWHGLQDPQMPSSSATSTESTQTPKQEALPKKIFCFVGSSGGPSTLPGSEEEEAGLFNQVHLSQLCS